MVFKSNRQRKAVMARLNGGTRSPVTPQIIKLEKKLAKEKVNIFKNRERLRIQKLMKILKPSLKKTMLGTNARFEIVMSKREIADIKAKIKSVK